jgi:type I restriction enzyme S subunit
MDKGALDKILIPISGDKRVIDYISALMQTIVEKEKAIRERHDAITATIEGELSANNRGKVFQYAFPVLSEIKKSSRFDSGLYCTAFRSFKHRVDDYKPGSTCLSKMGVKTRRGPNLAVSVIGKSLYSQEPKPGWYQLIRPVNISAYGTLAQREWLGSPKKLPLVQQGDLIMGCEGFEKGRTIVIVDPIDRCTTNFHGTVIYWPGSELWQIIFLRCFLAFLRERGVIDWVGVGGSGGHMSPDYFDYLAIPKFPDEKQREIARLYHQDAPPPGNPTLDTFAARHRQWNADLGICELDREMKVLQRTLAEG